ncbi:MAG: hypothetical protein SNJ62_12980, partial [Chloracidobacterium sp.]
MPTIWCAQHAVRFPFKSSSSRDASPGAWLDPSSDEQLCPAGHHVRLEGIYGYCPMCDLLWDAQQVENPDVCPYCQASDIHRRLCHTCQRLTYFPVAAEEPVPTCEGCGTPFDRAATVTHTCRALRTTLTTQRQQCPACQDFLHRSDKAVPATFISPTTDPTPAAVVISPPAVDKAPAKKKGIVITSPVRARDLHQQHLPNLIRVHFDYNLRCFLKNERGLFYACGVGEPPDHYHIIPSWSRFGVTGDFTHWFSQIFDCEQPRGGEIWVHLPAIADAEGTLIRKGRLEVNRPPDASRPSRPSVTEAAKAMRETSTVEVVHPLQPQETVGSAPPPATASPTASEAQPASPPGAPTAKRIGRQSVWLLLVLAVIGLSGLFTWKAYFGAARATKPPTTVAPVKSSRPNQPQAAPQTNQEAIQGALEGLALAFGQSNPTDYATYFDTTLSPYYARREAKA